MRVAVVYYTRFGHNAVIAEAVARHFGAEVRRIETTRKHGFAWMGCTALFNIRVGIKQMDLVLTGFDLVVLCAPIWAGRPASPVRTFLRGAKLPGKLAVCFSTGGGSSLRAREVLKQDLAGRGVEIVAFGEINTDKADEEYLRREAAAFADRVKA